MKALSHPRGLAAFTSRLARLRVAAFNLSAGAVALLLAATNAEAALRTYTATWSGASQGNTAEATATVVIDDAVLQNPGSHTFEAMGPGAAIVSFTITVTGDGAGNGTWSTTAGDYGDYLTLIHNALDLDAEWVGQPQPIAGSFWGPGGSGDFNVFSSTNGPIGSGTFTLGTQTGNQMVLTSFAPPGPPAVVPLGDLAVGQAVANVPGATVSVLYPSEIAEDGRIYLRAKIKGTGITGVNDDCLLRWDGEEANTVVREQAAVSAPGARILSFGDPVYHAGSLHFLAKLKMAETVTAANDSILLSVPSSGGASPTVIAHEGSSGDPLGRTLVGFDWFHPIDGGCVYGVKTKGTSGPQTFSSVTANMSGLQTSLAYVGGPVEINGVAHTIKTISKPTATAGANFASRAASPTRVSLYIVTTTGQKVVKPFEPAAAPVVFLPH